MSMCVLMVWNFGMSPSVVLFPLTPPPLFACVYLCRASATLAARPTLQQPPLPHTRCKPILCVCANLQQLQLPGPLTDTSGPPWPCCSGPHTSVCMVHSSMHCRYTVLSISLWVCAEFGCLQLSGPLPDTPPLAVGPNTSVYMLH